MKLIRTGACFPFAAALLALAAGCSGSADNGNSGGDGDKGGAGGDAETAGWILHAQPNPGATAAYKWVDIIEEAAARRIDKVGARPPIIAREMAIACQGMYDAWAAYDEKAVSLSMGGKLRRPAAERTQKNKETAIGYAIMRCLEYAYWDDVDWVQGQGKSMGLDPKNMSTDTATPEGIGNAVAASIIETRKHDGSNQAGDMACTNPPGKNYGDYTFYASKNPDPKVIVDPDHWQPIPWDDAKNPGKQVTPGFLCPHWYLVKPFIVDKADGFRMPGPPKVGSEQMKKEVDECIAYNSGMTPTQKSIVEFMRDGPRSTGQSGHWLHFAQDLSRRDKYDLDKDVKLFFCIAMVCNDGFIVCWEEKRFFDGPRPWSLVRWYYKGQKVKGWAGPCKGVVELPAEEWHPYSPFTFVTPPFPGYPSGHATVSGASARLLALYSGDDRFECVEKRKAGAMTESSCDLPTMMSVDGKPASDLPKEEVETLKLPTFTAVAEMAALSRCMGGYHIATDNNDGLALGRKVADASWVKMQALFDGTAK